MLIKVQRHLSHFHPDKFFPDRFPKDGHMEMGSDTTWTKNGGVQGSEAFAGGSQDEDAVVAA